MKNYFSKILVLLAVLGTTAQVHAYKYSFTNHTSKEEIAIAIRYYPGFGQSRHYLYIPKGEMRQFRPGDGNIPWSKIGLTPQILWYIVNPTATQKDNPKTGPWREFQITWVPSDSYQKAIDLAEAVGQTSEGAGKLALEAGGAYATGGASLVGEAAAGAAQQATDAARKATGAALTSAGSGVSGLGLANLLRNVGRVAAESMLTNRHIDIIEDETGRISFISLI